MAPAGACLLADLFRNNRVGVLRAVVHRMRFLIDNSGAVLPGCLSGRFALRLFRQITGDGFDARHTHIAEYLHHQKRSHYF